MTQSSIPFINYENSRFRPQTFATGSISSMNYKNVHFGPQTFASGSNSSLADSQIPFLPFSYPNTLLAAGESKLFVGRPPLRCSRGLAPPSPSTPTPHLWHASFVAAPMICARRRRRRCRRGGFALQQAARLEGPTFAETTATVRSRGSNGFLVASSEQRVGVGEG
jgi:hypothetical protein